MSHLEDALKKRTDALHEGLKRTKPYRLIQTYGEGLNRQELESFLTRDAVQAFDFYQHGAKEKLSDALPTRGVDRILAISKNLFLSFLMKLTPARRLFYAIALVLFIWGLFEAQWWFKVGAAFLMLNVLLAMELADKLLTKNELEVARAIQFSLQPKQRPCLRRLDMASHFQPASDVGGDFYDFSQADDDRVTVLLGDVSGKGMPAALYAMKLQGLFQLLAKSETSPKEMLVEMNEVFCERIRKDYFITALIGVLSFEQNKLTLARAGHNLPLYFDAASGRTKWLAPNGLGIGMARNPYFSNLVEEMTLPLGGGDVFVFYTDGITEAMNRKDEPFGCGRLEEILTRYAHLRVDEIKGQVLSGLGRFTRDAPLADDVTLVVAKVMG